MKRLLALLSGAGLALLLSSCTDYSTGYYGGSGYSSGYNSVASVGIIRTSNSYWGYDPYRRSYYNYRSSRYYDIHNNRYCSAPPRRHTAAVYPSHYRRGHTLSCPTPIARVRSPHRSSHGSSYGHGSHTSHGSQSPYGSSYGSRGSSNSRPSSSSSYRPDRISQSSGSRKSSDRGSSSGSSSSRQQTKTMPVVIHRTPSTTRTQPTLQRAPQRVQQRSTPKVQRSTPTPSRVQSRPTVKSVPARSRSTSSPQPSNRRKVR